MSGPGAAEATGGGERTAGTAAPISDRRSRRGRMGLSLKFALALIGLISLALLANGAVNMWLSYGETKRAAVLVQQEKAQAAAERIHQFVSEIEQQIGWTTHAQWSAGSVDQRRYDFVRLLRQVPAITELVQIDSAGKEQLKVSRLAMDVVGSGVDLSTDPRFTRAVADRVWYSPVYFRKESEPYMTISVLHFGRNAGVTVAEVNLKFIWDVVTAIKVGQAGYAFVVNGQGRLIAHPDISLVLRDTDLARLPQVASALAALPNHASEANMVGTTLTPEGGKVLTAYAAIPALDWLVFVELPLREAMAPVYSALLENGLLLGLGLLLAAIAGAMLARRMTVPIRELQAGAERLGSGELGHRIEIRTGDEIEVLADRFNRMAGQIAESHATLEARVEERTRDLAEALDRQTGTSEVLRVISQSPGNLDAVFSTMLENARRICRAEFGRLALHDDGRFPTAAVVGGTPEYRRFLEQNPVVPSDGSVLHRLAAERRIIQLLDLTQEQYYRERHPYAVAAAELGRARTLLAVPLLKEGALMGALVLFRQHVEAFTEKEIALVATFADQAVIAIENAHLLQELRRRTADLARSVEDLRTLSVVGQAVTSSLDLKTVLGTVVARAVELANAEGGAIFRYRRTEKQFQLWHAAGFDTALMARLHDLAVDHDRTELGHAARDNQPVEIADLAAAAGAPLRDIFFEAGFRSALIVPLVRGGRIFGALVVQRKRSGPFSGSTLDILQTFASQSVLAIQNARLFREIEENGRQLEIASQHKSQFLANMSHELRTPLNAILGYAELLVDGIYGELSEKARGVLERVQNNGKHLLGLINDVLDLSKIEAGQLTLSISDYAMPSVIEAVTTATESLAKAKGLTLEAATATDLPLGRGDERRLTQVLLNLVGNAIKFTDTGSVRIAVHAANGYFDVAVSDTGPGIAESDQAKIFEEFRQVDNSDTRRKGGTGLGLSISRRIVELHGGSITVESELGKGSTFHVIIPVAVDMTKEVA